EVRTRTRLPVSADRRVDDPRSDLRDRLVVDAEPGHHAGAKALDEDVRMLCERVERIASARVLQIERDAALVAVDRAKERRHAPGPGTERARVVASARVF